MDTMDDYSGFQHWLVALMAGLLSILQRFQMNPQLMRHAAFRDEIEKIEHAIQELLRLPY